METNRNPELALFNALPNEIPKSSSSPPLFSSGVMPHGVTHSPHCWVRHTLIHFPQQVAATWWGSYLSKVSSCTKPGAAGIWCWSLRELSGNCVFCFCRKKTWKIMWNLLILCQIFSPIVLPSLPFISHEFVNANGEGKGKGGWSSKFCRKKGNIYAPQIISDLHSTLIKQQVRSHRKLRSWSSYL